MYLQVKTRSTMWSGNKCNGGQEEMKERGGQEANKKSGYWENNILESNTSILK